MQKLTHFTVKWFWFAIAAIVQNKTKHMELFELFHNLWPGCYYNNEVIRLTCVFLRVRELEGALRLSQLSALSLLEMSSSESLGVEHGEPLSTSSNLRFRPRDDTVSMETLRLEALQIGTSFVRQTDRLLLAKLKHEPPWHF